MTTRKKATSVKFDEDVAKQIKERCDSMNCSQSDFIQNAVKKVFNESNFENNDNGKNDKIYSVLDPEPEPIPQLIISDEYGNVWIDGKLQELENVTVSD